MMLLINVREVSSAIFDFFKNKFANLCYVCTTIRFRLLIFLIYIFGNFSVTVDLGIELNIARNNINIVQINVVENLFFLIRL